MSMSGTSSGAANMDLIQGYDNLRIDDDDDDGVEGLVISAEEAPVKVHSTRLCLFGKFLSDKAVNFNAMKTTLATLWRPMRGVKIKNLGQQLFSFQFYHDMDLERVISQGPWSFDQSILVLVPYEVCCTRGDGIHFVDISL